MPRFKSAIFAAVVAGAVSRPALVASAARAETTTQTTTEMTADEHAAFRAEMRACLHANPGVLMEAIGVLERRDRAAQTTADVDLARVYTAQLQFDGVSFVGGNAEGDVVIVEFMDYRCGYCRRAFAQVEEPIETDGNIRFALKALPILGPQAVMAAQFAFAAKFTGGDDAYKAAHDALMTLEADIAKATLHRLAEGLGLDAGAIFGAMESARVAQVLADNAALATALAIFGTPTFVMNDPMLRGYVPPDRMELLVEGLRAEG